MQCNGQIDAAEVARDREGLLDDPAYIAAAGLSEPERQNVALLALSVTAMQLAQFVSYTVAPGGQGDPGPLQYSLSNHALIHLPTTTQPTCLYETQTGAGDHRTPLVPH